MPRSARQGGVERKKLPPLAFGVDGVDPRPIGHLTAQPGGLALGVSAGFALGVLQTCRQGNLARQDGGELAIADRLHGRQVGGEIAGGEGRDLVQRAALGHGLTYQYPHDFDGGWVAQQYLPDALKGASYYRERPYGQEGSMAAAWHKRRGGK